MMTKIYQSLKNPKGQVSLYFIGIMASLVALTFVVINIGKIAKDKTYADNAADAGSLAAASAMATAFNYVADVNSGNDRQGNRSNKEEMRKHSEQRTNSELRKYHDQNRQNWTEAMMACNNAIGSLSPPSLPEDKKIEHEALVSKENIVGKSVVAAVSENIVSQNMSNGAEPHRRNLKKVQQRKLDEAKKDTDGNKQTKDCYYNWALVAGYKFNFYNAGVFHRLGRINQKRFDQFLKGITKDTVQNGMPLTFFWADGAGRAHTVTAIVEIEPCDNWNVRMSKDSDQKQRADAKQSGQHYDNGAKAAQRAQKHRQDGIEHPLLDPSVFSPLGWADEKTAKTEITQGWNKHQEHFQGHQENQNQVINQSKQAETHLVQYVDDIIHSQTVYSSNFQFHMGGIVKGMRGDVDILGPTFYPPVQAGAITTFNATQQGQISRGDNMGDSNPAFDSAELIGI